MRICVADDEQEVRESIINKLRQIAADSEIYDIGFGLEAMHQLEVIWPDLVLLRNGSEPNVIVTRQHESRLPVLHSVSGFSDFGVR